MSDAVGAYLRAVRKATCPLVTQEELADRIGKDQNYISQVETGRIKRPDQQVLIHWARALELDVADVLRRAGLEVMLSDRDVKIPIRGVIPADRPRWASGEGAPMQFVRVLADDVQDARFPNELFGLYVSGDCMTALGIWSGDVVIVEPPHGRIPRDRQLVIIRINDEVTLKRWIVTGDGFALEDGDGSTVYHYTGQDDVEVLGFYVTWKPIASRQ